VPKKTKIVQDEIERSAGSGVASSEVKIDKRPPARRPTGPKKPAAAAKIKSPAKAKAVKSSKPVPAIEPTDEEIRIRAYFVAERRHRLELAGDAGSDWLEAKRQLLSERGPR
jgi:DUF2934 family protein